MKIEAILKVIAGDLGTSDIAKINEIFKAETFKHIKYTMKGKKLGYLGYTVNIKNIANDGLKIFLTNKVKLIRFEDIEQFEKAKPKVKRPVLEKKPALVAAKKRPTAGLEQKDSKNAKDSTESQESKDSIEAKVKYDRKAARKTPAHESRFIPKKS